MTLDPSRLDRFFTPRPRPPAPEPAPARPSLNFSSLGGREVRTALGTTLVLERLYPWDAVPGALSWQKVQSVGWRPERLGRQLPEAVPLEGLACVDIETTGLSLGAGTVAFLVGAICAGPDGLRLSQFLMRDFHEEAAQQTLLAEYLHGFDVVCTYNGARFDLPILRSRSVLHRIEADWLNRPHLDLLYPVRSVWKSEWPDCRLATAEFRLLGVVRHLDCEGWEVPLRYREFLQAPDESALFDVLEHNAQDLLSLACLAAALERVYDDGFDGFGFTQAELLALARSLSLRGRTETAVRTYRRAAALGRLAPDLHGHFRHYVRLLKQGARWEDARKVWLDMGSCGDSPYAYWGWLEEAKYLEHREKRFPAARAAAEQALAALRALPAGTHRERLAALLEARCERLKQKQKPA